MAAALNCCYLPRSPRAKSSLGAASVLVTVGIMQGWRWGGKDLLSSQGSRDGKSKDFRTILRVVSL